MAVTKTRAGTNPDGTPHWSYVTDTDDPHLVVTGPAAGIVKAADGTEYTVDEDVIERVLALDELDCLHDLEPVDLAALGAEPALQRQPADQRLVQGRSLLRGRARHHTASLDSWYQ